MLKILSKRGLEAINTIQKSLVILLDSITDSITSTISNTIQNSKKIIIEINTRPANTILSMVIQFLKIVLPILLRAYLFTNY